jgi:cobalt/nickel transport system permease protein
MHIPDGYLSPSTCVATYAVSAVCVGLAAKKVAKELDERKIPLIAVASAFSFVIMMFNIPIPGGTTGHAVGGTLIAILLGPWTAMLAISLALLVQALLFGDGGVTTFGANCLTMGVIMPFVGYSFYRMISGDGSSKKRSLAGTFIGSYIGINLAAFAVAVLLGIQPMIASDAKGIPLYSPFPLKITVTVMMAEHLTFFGLAEALTSVLVLKYLMSFDLRMESKPQLSRRLSLGIVLLTMLSPLGVIMPATFHAGGAWGEWGSSELKDIAGIIPGGLARLETLWKAPLPDYILPIGPQESLLWQSLWYAICAMIGVLLVSVSVMALKLIRQKSDG